MLSREELKDATNCDTINCFDCRLLNKRPCLTTITQTALELMNQVETQQKEINKLKIEKAIHKSALEEAIETIENVSGRETEQTGKYRDIINNSAAAYHNPKDLKEIEQIKAQNEAYREALEGIKKKYTSDFTESELDNLEPRDKSILYFWVINALNN